MSVSEPVPDLAYYAAVPYVLMVESVEHGGVWRRRAAYPELPGCVVEAESATEAMEQLERARRRLIEDLWHRGEPIPVPRPPLRVPRLLG